MNNEAHNTVVYVSECLHKPIVHICVHIFLYTYFYLLVKLHSFCGVGWIVPEKVVSLSTIAVVCVSVSSTS